MDRRAHPDRRALLAGVCALLLSAGAARAAEPGEDAPANYGGAFILQDQRGRSVTDEDFHGKFMLIAFGYTHCPDICPTLLATMANALNRLGPDGADITPVFVTLDPERDTPAVLADYASSFSPRMVALTGPQAYIDNVAAKYHIEFRKVPEAKGGYSVDHGAAIFLMGRDGRFIEKFSASVSAEVLADRLRARVKTPQP